MMRFLIAVPFAVLFGLSAHAQDLSLDKMLQRSATQGCAAEVSPPVPRSRAASDAMKVLPPEHGAYIGAYQIPAQPNEVARFARAMGRMPPIVFSFHDFFSDTNGGRSPDQRFTDPLEGDKSPRPLDMNGWLNERESVLALAWAVYCCDYNSTMFWLRLNRPHDHVNRLLAGQHDDIIRETARTIRADGRPIMLTLVPEMNWQGQFLFGADGRRWMDAVDNICNKYGDPRWPDGPERIRDLYIRVIDIFRQEDVKNVTWFMYSGNQYMAPGVEGQSRWLHPKYYYPGDAYIDWTGQSVSFTRPEWTEKFEDIGTFDEVFLPGYRAWQSVTAKPMLLAEFGILAPKGADRRDLWQGLLSNKLKSVPGVRAVTIADSLLFQEHFNIPMLSTNAREIEAFARTAGPNSYFTGKLRLP